MLISFHEMLVGEQVFLLRVRSYYFIISIKPGGMTHYNDQQGYVYILNAIWGPGNHERDWLKTDLTPMLRMISGSSKPVIHVWLTPKWYPQTRQSNMDRCWYWKTKTSEAGDGSSAILWSTRSLTHIIPYPYFGFALPCFIIRESPRILNMFTRQPW